MCLQCLTKPDRYGNDKFLDTYAVMRATKDPYEGSSHNEWPKGTLALVFCNDPDFVFRVDPIKDPSFGLSDETIDGIYADSIRKGPHKIASDLHFDSAQSLNEDVLSVDSLRLVTTLVLAAAASGYDSKKDGGLEHWLCHKLAEFIETRKVYKDGEE